MTFRLVNFLLCVAAGLLLAASFPPLGWHPLIWVWPWPLLVVLWRRKPKGGPVRRIWFGFRSGFVAGMAFFLTNLSWIQEVTMGGWPALSAYLALYFAAWGGFVALVEKRTADDERDRIPPRPVVRLAGILAAACFWCFLEWVRGWLMTGFGWNGVGVALRWPFEAIQPAEWIGVAGLAVLPMFVSQMLLAAILEKRCRFCAIAGGVFLAWLGIGFWAKSRVKVGSESLQILLVQPAVSQERKWEAAVNQEVAATLPPEAQERILAFRQEQYDQLFRLTKAGLEAGKTDVVIWPESAVPFQLYEKESTDFLMRFAELGDFALILGCDVIDDSPYNSLAAMRSGFHQLEIYKKVHLVPFGEYVPLRYEIPLLNDIAGDLIPYDFSRGASTDPLPLPGTSMQIIPQVCFEDTVPRLTRKFVRESPQMIVNVTNDGWFRESAASEQHFWNARLRAVELRRPLVRAANTGVTAAVDSAGRVLGRCEKFHESSLRVTLPLPDENRVTLYAAHGDVFSAAAGPLAIALALFRRRSAKGR